VIAPAAPVADGIVRIVQTCPECGNHDMKVRVVDGAPVHECCLCFARFGERLAVEALHDAEEARLRGVASGIWPLVRALERLPGLCVRTSGTCDLAARTLPFVELGVISSESLVQLENLAKSLLLSAGATRLHWVIEVVYQHHLAFVLKPRHAGGAVPAEEVRDAGIDVDVLRRAIERDSKLSWWRHAGVRANG
jgi:hypothetical protein